ncbi:hypothetical protein B0H15DRAFT_1024405 [Mycena belliarum]|uniref:Uncharacterized protein n=1 Tax=Mycena belliarum TaxID=1033014 RepID=A0AAD6XNQ3_9AGAR|nr:hypothetical protein B0H15DRAFT_1024405 [Mycena belliae]
MSSFLVRAVRCTQCSPRWASSGIFRRWHSVDTAGKKKTPCIISSLNPSLISPADYLDISGRVVCHLEFPASKNPPTSTTVVWPRVQDGIGYGYESFDAKKQERVPFPDNTHGFLYFQCGPHTASLEGSIRFRVTTDSSPQSFGRGEDLLVPSGFPWQISLAQVACRGTFATIGLQLLRDGLVTEAQLLRCRDLFDKRTKISPAHTLYTLDSPFLVNFSGTLNLTVVGAKLQGFRMTVLFAVSSGMRGEPYYRHYPWSGSAIARFERSTLPEYAGRRVLHLRFIRILEPASATMDRPASSAKRVLRPEEGQLLTISCQLDPPSPWAYDIDKPRVDAAAALRALWDNSG